LLASECCIKGLADFSGCFLQSFARQSTFFGDLAEPLSRLHAGFH
jgi:hypothetical protein